MSDTAAAALETMGCLLGSPREGIDDSPKLPHKISSPTRRLPVVGDDGPASTVPPQQATPELTPHGSAELSRSSTGQFEAIVAPSRPPQHLTGPQTPISAVSP